MTAWFERNWMYAGLLAGVFLLLLAPVAGDGLGWPLVIVFLQLPAYMLHQVEEHHADRFRRWVNDTVAGGREALTTRAVLVINVPGVWGVNLAALYLARFVDIGLGLAAVYLTLFNAVVHVVGAVAKRAYNPGLVTAVLVFLPLGSIALAIFSLETDATAGQHAAGLGVAVLIHAAIVVHVRRRLRLLETARA